MKSKLTKLVILVCACITMVSCTTATPDEFFQKTVLNSNILFGFATDKLAADVIADTAPEDQYYSMTIYSKAHYLNKIIPDIEDTKAPDEDGEKLKELSLDLYKFALPILENDYKEIAKLNAENADKDVIDQKIQALNDKYQDVFYTKYEALITLGEAYAKKHNLNASFD